MKKIIKKIIAISLVGATIIPTSITAFAQKDTIDTTVINEKWGKPTFVYGESLTKDEINKTMKLLGITNPENVNIKKVTKKDLYNYIGGDGSGSMISSVIVEKKDKDNGVNVVIKTPDNITQITKEQYENASITAGVANSNIVIGAVRKVTGESALTGIYKAFEANGEKLNKERMETAQEELVVVNGISQENKSKKGFNTNKLDTAIVEIKNKLAEIKSGQDKLPTREEVKNIVQNAIREAKLENIVSNTQVNNLVNYFQQYTNTSAIDSSEVKKQLNDLSNKLVGEAKNIYKTAKDNGIIDQIVGFFKSLVNGIASLFN